MQYLLADGTAGSIVVDGKLIMAGRSPDFQSNTCRTKLLMDMGLERIPLRYQGQAHEDDNETTPYGRFRKNPA